MNTRVLERMVLIAKLSSNSYEYVFAVCAKDEGWEPRAAKISQSKI
jgi:hypothetical protein